MKRLLLVPHGQTSWNAEGRVQGHTDVVMNELGQAQARALARSLAQEKIGAIISSDLQRAWETASIIGEQVGVAVSPDPRLREIHFGDWEGLTSQEIAVQDPPGWERWEKGIITSPPRGESLTSLAARLAESLAEIANLALAQDDGRAVMVVAHRGSLRVLVCLALGLDPGLMHRFRLEQTSVTELFLSASGTGFPARPSTDGLGSPSHFGAVLNRLNDTHHLREVAHAR